MTTEMILHIFCLLNMEIWWKCIWEASHSWGSILFFLLDGSQVEEGLCVSVVILKNHFLLFWYENIPLMFSTWAMLSLWKIFLKFSRWFCRALWRSRCPRAWYPSGRRVFSKQCCPLQLRTRLHAEGFTGKNLHEQRDLARHPAWVSW